MSKKKLKHKKKQDSSFFRYCFGCAANPNDKLSEKSVYTKGHNHKDQKLKKRKVRKKHSKVPMKPELELRQMSPTNILLSKAYLEKVESTPIEKENLTPTQKIVEKEKAEKDEMIKTILSKYLQIKREEMLQKDTSKDQSDNVKTLQPKTSDFINIECLSSDSSETLILENDLKPKLDSKRKLEYPIKSRSAPTNSAAHDSLADICFKMNKYKQENKSDSYVTCCSEASTDYATTKKKLELVFNQSSDEISISDYNSTASLQYKIRCKTPKEDGIVQEIIDRESYEYIVGQSRGTKPANKDSFVHPFAEGEIGGVDESSSSLKWKLIISHHNHTDFP